jgi:hypothetical protein
VRRVALASLMLLASCSVGRNIATELSCDTDNRARELLITQAVPSATLIPCVETLLPGWTYSGSDVRSGEARFWLDSDRAGIRSVEVSLTDGCSVAGLRDITTSADEIGVRAFVRWVSFEPYSVDRIFVFDGGCVTYRYRFGDTEGSAVLAAEVDRSLTFLPRSAFVRGAREGAVPATLCGAGAPPCVGEP